MFHPYATPGFLCSSSSLAPSDSLDSSAASTSIYTTTSSSTVPGIGSLSGKFFLGFGKTILRGVENAVIRRRLSQIESLCPLSDSNPPRDVERVYDDMLELARPGFYSNHIREKMLSLICEQIWRRQTLYLMRSLERLPSLERVIVTCEILENVWQTIKLSDVGVLDRIISLYQQVLVRFAPQNPDRPILLHRISFTLSKRFDKTGELADLEQAILLGREALQLLPQPHSDRLQLLSNLSYNLFMRFKQTGQPADLREANVLHEALRLRPSDGSKSLQTLAPYLSSRPNQTGQFADVGDVPEPMPHHDRSKLLRSLIRYLSSRFHQTSQPSYLEQAVLLHEELQLLVMPQRRPERLTSLHSLTRYLSSRFDQPEIGQLADVDEAALLGYNAPELTPPAHSNQLESHHHATTFDDEVKKLKDMPGSSPGNTGRYGTWISVAGRERTLLKEILAESTDVFSTGSELIEIYYEPIATP